MVCETFVSARVSNEMQMRVERVRPFTLEYDTEAKQSFQHTRQIAGAWVSS
jgi:hypothetical protein